MMDVLVESAICVLFSLCPMAPFAVQNNRSVAVAVAFAESRECGVMHGQAYPDLGRLALRNIVAVNLLLSELIAATVDAGFDVPGLSGRLFGRVGGLRGSVCGNFKISLNRFPRGSQLCATKTAPPHVS